MVSTAIDELVFGSASADREVLATPDPAAADTLFRAHQKEIYVRTDRLIAWLMGVQYLAGIAFALWVSPRTWIGPTSQTNVHVWAAIVLGFAISALPIALAVTRPGETSTRYTLAIAQMLMSALLIHLTGGRIETHFHVFGSLAILAFYRDWRVLVPATIVVALDHWLRGLFWPQSVYGVLVASQWRWLEHAAWVVFEDIFLVISCLRGTDELHQIAERTVVLQQAHRAQARQAVAQSELIARLQLSQQEAEAATRAKSEFVANMSHELRTPLNAISLYAELLQETAEEDGRSTDVGDLGRIQSASKHLLGLINGLLDLSKVEAGKMDLNCETFDVRNTVHELVSTMELVIKKNGNQLEVVVGADVGSMHADLTKTRQVLFNLLSNAAKFTTGGAILLRVDRDASGDAPLLRFAVRDSGIGLTEEQQRKLFRPFAQADASVTRKYGGTGLGLALVSRFCQMMGGRVTVESQIGHGATFTAILPEAVATSDAAQQAA